MKKLAQRNTIAYIRGLVVVLVLGLILAFTGNTRTASAAPIESNGSEITRGYIPIFTGANSVGNSELFYDPNTGLTNYKTLTVPGFSTGYTNYMTRSSGAGYMNTMSLKVTHDSPTPQVQSLYGITATAAVAASRSASGFVAGGLFSANNFGASGDDNYGMQAFCGNYDTGTVERCTAGRFGVQSFGSGGTITNAIGVLINHWEDPSSQMRNSYGIYIDNSIDKGTLSRHAIYSLSTSDSYLAGKLGIGSGTSSPAYALDIVGSGIRIANTAADATNKMYTLVDRHFNNSEEDFLLFMGQSKAAANTINIGGGVSAFNAASAISFYTAPNSTTLAGTEAMRIESNQNVIFNSVVRLKGYTVATLPAGTQGDTAFVTDALAPVYLTPVVGGGAVVTPVFFNGTNWVAN